MPIAFIAKARKFTLEKELYEVYARADRNTNEETQKEYETDKKECLDKIEEHENIVVLSLVVESSLEASFQFFFQTVYVLPSLVLSLTGLTGSDWTVLVNWRMFSIILSFASFAKSFYSIRNRAKRNSFTSLNLVFLLMKTILDCVARIVLFSTWLYVQNEGQFSSTKTVIAYYSTLMVLVLFNAYFTKSKKNVTRRNMTEVTLNAMSSVLSYNQFDFGPIFKHGEKAKEERRGEKHQPSFVKQLMYFILFIVLNLGLTISVEITMMSMDSVKLVDINGNIHMLSKLQVRVMMAVGWMAFMGSWLMNVLFYKVHPSSPDFSKEGMREKLFIHVQGEKRYLCGYKDSKGETEEALQMQGEDERREDNTAGEEETTFTTSTQDSPVQPGEVIINVGSE